MRTCRAADAQRLGVERAARRPVLLVPRGLFAQLVDLAAAGWDTRLRDWVLRIRKNAGRVNEGKFPDDVAAASWPRL
jgi:hypothetical protein